MTYATDPEVRAEAIRFAEEELGWGVVSVHRSEEILGGWEVVLHVLRPGGGEGRLLPLFIHPTRGASEVRPS